MSAAESELRETKHALRLCQLELAQVRCDQEPLVEELESLRSETDRIQQRLYRVASALDRQLLSADAGRSIPERSARWLRRQRRRRTSSGRQEAALIDSGLLDGAWYFARYPEAARSGMTAAEHYLAIGASQGKDPGPDFDAKAYLKAHPEVSASGENPVFHHLDSLGQKPQGSQ